jgi:hypothetical protein
MPLKCACTSPPTQMVKVYESLMTSAVKYMCMVCQKQKIVTDNLMTGEIRVQDK